MGGSSSKRSFPWQKKKKKSPLDKARSQLRGALPFQKRKKKSVMSLNKLNLDNLKKKERPSQKRFSLSADKKESTPLKRFSLGNTRKEKDGGGLGKVGEQIKRKLSQDPKTGLGLNKLTLPL